MKLSALGLHLFRLFDAFAPLYEKFASIHFNTFQSCTVLGIVRGTKLVSVFVNVGVFCEYCECCECCE